ncbi:hypothetical protein Tco_0705776 [Tanacetum coccineum]|uniref:Reverse transcriptase domain-containing protein n=1 Tax=Tanacetum coccineum TaxID=301880 RepID=A0ABQ4Y6E8_9ASTR
MDFPEFYKELEAEFLEQVQRSWGYNFFNWSSDWGRFLLGVSVPSSQLKFYGSFGLQVHLGFHLLMMILGASGSPPCGCEVFEIGERHLPIESIIASRSTDVMMAAAQTTNNNSIRSILKKEKLNGSNFLDWYRNLRIVLRNKQKLHHLEEALPEVPPTTVTADVRLFFCQTFQSFGRHVFHSKLFVTPRKFQFPADFVVVDFEPDPRVPLILGRCFLKIGRALIDVYEGKLTLRVGNEAITYNLDQLRETPFNYNE